jgi:predicted glycosyl hydrolase (DUF1957 family)
VRERVTSQAAAAVAAAAAADVDHLPPAVLAALLAASASLIGRVAAQMASAASAEPADTSRTAPGADRFITVADAAQRLRTDVKWLYRRKGRLPFLVELSPRYWRVSTSKLAAWMRSGRSPSG